MSVNYPQLLRTFEDPPAASRPMMFWIWNGDLHRQRIEQQVADMAQKGCGGFFIHPMGEAFRLQDFVRGMSPGYLSDGYFEAVRWAVEAAATHGLYAWLYDEGGWPSGTAQGKVLEGHPEHTAQVLTCRPGPAHPGRWNTDTVAVLATFADRDPQVVEPDAAGAVLPPTGATGLLWFVTAPMDGHVDLLSPAAVARFIEVTHERYAACVGEHFGKTIPGIFTDEPAVVGRVASARLPWTPRMLQEFSARKGLDLRPHLPALFSEDVLPAGLAGAPPPQQRAQVRCAFCDVWTDLYHQAYWEQLNDWCAAHGLIHTGHVGGEDNLPDHARHGFGHFFKTAGSLHAPGVDVIWRQVDWDRRDNFDFPQFASSAAHQRPGQGGGEEGTPFDNLVLTETNGVYGFGLTFEQMRWLVDWQALRGVNLIAPMAYSYTTEGGRLFRTQDHMGPGNPLWQYYRGFADYVGRLCTVLRQGVALADIAVYYPIEPLWADPEGEEGHQAWASLRQVTAALHEEQAAFDFIDAGALRAAEISQGALETPGQDYSTIIVPQTPFLPLDVLQKLRALYDAGGRVVFIGSVPEGCSDLGCDDAYASVRQALAERVVEMDTESEALRYDETAALDGLSSAFLGPRGSDHFSAEVSSPQAVLVVPEDEIGRLARLLALKVGRFSIQPDGVVPDLRMIVRDLDPLQVAFVTNESSEPLEFALNIVHDSPALLERWHPVDGETRVLAVHQQVSELTRVPMRLRPGGSALLVLSPLRTVPPEKAASVVVRPRHPVIEVVIERLEEPDAIRVVEELRVREGTVQSLVPPPTPAPRRLGAWDDMDMADFTGSVAYEFHFSVAAEYLRDEVFLDLGQVGVCAALQLNGVQLPPRLWHPYTLEVSRWLVEHENSLTVTVTNTLANQMTSEPVVAEARQNGWYNVYYDKALPMMQRRGPSGLMGPIRLYVRG